MRWFFVFFDKMVMMQEKMLWKIEELWKKYYQSILTENISVLKNYKNGISKYYSRFHYVNVFDFETSQGVVFSDEYGEYYGLQKFQVITKDKKYIYLFDNHNEMLYPILEIALGNKKNRSLNIVHIDAHPDDAKFQTKKELILNLENISDYIEKTRISDFFDAINNSFFVDNGEQKKLLGDIFRITHSNDFEFFLPPKEPYVLSLDIDIFGPEGDFTSLENKVRAIALAWSQADAVCIATSPGFIDQEFAQKIIEIFIKK